MLLADRPETEATTTIAADPTTVWRLVSDLNTPARFSDEFRGAEWVDGVEPGPGATFLGHNERGRFRWTVTCTVTRWEPERVFEWVVEDPTNPVAEWRFVISPVSADIVRLTQWCRMGVAPSGLTMAIERSPDREEEIVAARMERHRQSMAETIAGIKQLAEHRSPTTVGSDETGRT